MEKFFNQRFGKVPYPRYAMFHDTFHQSLRGGLNGATAGHDWETVHEKSSSLVHYGACWVTARFESKFHGLIPWIEIICAMRHRTSVKRQEIHRATAIPATASSPAATEPMLFVAAPVKPGDPADPVFEGATSAIGDPVAVAPKPELALTLEPQVPVAIGAVPVANPVDTATTVELG